MARSTDGQLKASFLEAFARADVRRAKAILDGLLEAPPATDYRAHPWLRECVVQNKGHCYRGQHLEIAEFLTPEPVLGFRDAVIRGEAPGVERRLAKESGLVQPDDQALPHVPGVAGAGCQA